MECGAVRHCGAFTTRLRRSLGSEPVPAKRGTVASGIGERSIEARFRVAPEDTTTAVTAEARAVRALSPRSRPVDLTANQLEALLEELLAAYVHPAFQAEFALAKNRAEEHGDARATALSEILGSVVLRVQAPVLRRYGLPPDAHGVALMKHAVQRRVAEGSQRLEVLANEARRSLGLQPLPDRRASAEEVVTGRVDVTVARLGLQRSEVEEVQRTAFKHQLHTACESGKVTASSAGFIERMLEDVPLPSAMALLTMAKCGLAVNGVGGLAGDSCGNDVCTEADLLSVLKLDSPSASDFFRSCVLPNRPALLSGVFDSKCFQPLRDFKDHDFLRRHCGHRRVLVKSLALRDAAGRSVFVSDPELRLPFSDFLDAAEEHGKLVKRPSGNGGTVAVGGAVGDSVESGGEGADFRSPSSAGVPFYLGKVSLRQELPELADAIDAADACPKRVFGDCFGNQIPAGVVTYFGFGRNTTAVHFDGHENLMLCVSGQKRLLLYQPSDARFLYPVNNGLSRSGVVPFTPFCELSEELQAKLPLAARARPIEVRVSPGEILYIPACWWHCVEGSEEENMILNWWFDIHPQKHATTRQ